MAERNKIFGIGYSKTGTTSLTKALQMLGINALHFPFHAMRHSNEELTLNYDRLQAREAYTDTPIPLFYKDIDKKFPGSKFILTVRDMDAWLRSCEKNHVWPGEYVHDKAIRNQAYVRTLLNLHYELYGAVSFQREAFRRSHENYIEDVMNYFKDRPDDLIVMDVCCGDGWQKLCAFLEKEIPDVPFPRTNVGMDKYFKRETRRLFWKWVAALHFGTQRSVKYVPKYQE